MVKAECSADGKNCFMNPGFLSPHLEAFLSDLERQGYTRLTIGNFADSVAHFAEWAGSQGLAIEELRGDVLTRFGKHRCRCPGGRRHQTVSRKYVNRVRRFIRYLETQGLIASAHSVLVNQMKEPLALVREFVQWLCDHRGVEPISVRHYTEQLERLPAWLVNAETCRINAASIRALVLERAPAQSAVMRSKIGSCPGGHPKSPTCGHFKFPHLTS